LDDDYVTISHETVATVSKEFADGC